MQIVNGYICMNCCDVDKARMGQDPHQSADQLKKQIERHLDRLAAGNFGPAVALGGSLQGAAATPGSQSQEPGSPQSQSSQSQGLGGGDSAGAPSGLDIVA